MLLYFHIKVDIILILFLLDFHLIISEDNDILPDLFLDLINFLIIFLLGYLYILMGLIFLFFLALLCFFVECVFEFNFTVSKRSNSISCSWGSWTKNLNFNQETNVVFSANNADVPITVTQKTGNTIATYHSTPQNTIRASYSVGEATWFVSQAENYKYVATDTNTLTVNVGVISNSCDVYSGYSEEKEASKVGDIVLPKAGIGDVLYFQMRKNQAAGNQATLRIYGENNNLIDEQKPEAEHMLSYTSHSVTLPAGAKTIQFAKGGTYNDTDDPYIKDIRISRKSWLTLQGSDGSEITSLTMPLNTTSTSVANSKTVKFYIDYSVCAEQIKVASNNAKITVSDALFSTST